MLWIKRNLFLVVGGVAAVGLLVFGILYLLGNYQKNNAVEEELKQAKETLRRLSDLSPTANADNITKARAELDRVQKAINFTKTRFTPLPYDKAKGPAFKALLDTTVDGLQKAAAQAGVGLPLPKGYAFTFTEQQKRLQFSEGSFPTLTEQLAEIKAISTVLFNAKINKLTGLRRGRVTSDDPAGASDYHEMKPERSLGGAVLSPYIAEFNSFSTELASVLEGFYKSPNGLFVKAVEVKPLESTNVFAQPAPVAAPVNPAPGAVPPGTARPTPRNLLTPGAPGAPAAPGTPRPLPRPAGGGAAKPPGGGPGGASSEGFRTVLDEQMLKITLWIDVLKPPPAK